MSIREKVEELQKAFQDELGERVKIDLWVHGIRVTGFTEERGREIAQRFAEMCGGSVSPKYVSPDQDFAWFNCEAPSANFAVSFTNKKETAEAAN